ncbi:MAG: hypothetical protein GF308_18465 [Candidatus Heimdallarchaeota archaeon]|nr:hypothetical protein [Candidatus Heimdallarchaeota archaeon]
MVKHPKYQAMDDARESEIPRAFNLFCKEGFSLRTIKPSHSRESEAIPAGPIPRPTFEVVDEQGEKMAEFYPNGHSKCFDEKFQNYFDQMVVVIEKAAQRALEEFEKHY